MSGTEFYAYIRVSTAKQGEKGVSLQEQKDAILRYAERNRYAVIEWFEERETAASRGRPVFNRMLQLLRKRRVRGVLIHKIDRSARNLKDWADLGELIDQGIEVHFANEGLDLHSRGGRLSADIQAVVAADFIRNLREETRKGMWGRFKQGLYPLRAPLGYLDCGPGKAKQIDPIKGPLVRQAFELYASGKYSLIRLREEVARRGLSNLRGRHLSINSLAAILHNPFYAGLIAIKKSGETFQGAHEALIPMRLYKDVQSVLAGKVSPRLLKHEFLFRKLIRCAGCERTLVGELAKGRVYYRCPTRDCPTKTIREDRALETVIEALQTLNLAAATYDILVEKTAGMEREAEKMRLADRQSRSLRLNQMKERLNRLTDAYLDRLMEKDAYEDRRRLILIEQQELEDLARNDSAAESGALNRTAELISRAQGLGSMLIAATGDEQRALLRILTSNLTLRGRKLDVMLAPPLPAMQNFNTSLYGVPNGNRTHAIAATERSSTIKL